MAREKILVIDDEKEFLDLVRRRLEAEGYDVMTASNGIEGLDMVRGDRPDLVICDIRMPLKDGFEVLREIREGVDKRLPIIIVSVIDDFDKITKVYEDEADFFASKPVELITLSKNIRTLLNLSKGKQER